jgi:hypothetical protein
MLQGSLVRILSEYSSEPSSAFLDFGIGHGTNTTHLTGKIGIVLGISKMTGMYDVYDILLDDGSIESVEDLRLRKIGTDDKKEIQTTLQGGRYSSG